MKYLSNKIHKLSVAAVNLGHRRKVPTEKRIEEMATAPKVDGQLNPILVRGAAPVNGRKAYYVVCGATRLEAARSLGWETIQAVVVGGTHADYQIAEIAENLHRADLTALERSELFAEWIRLTEERAHASGVRTHEKAGQQPGGINAASRELGIPKSTAHECVKVAALSTEAKQAAVEAGLDDNRSALIEAAKAGGPTEQIKALKERARRKPSPSSPPAKNPIAAAWDRATKPEQGCFALSYSIKIRNTQQFCGMNNNSDRREAEQLRGLIAELETENDRLRTRIAVLEAADRAEARSKTPPDDGLDVPREFRRSVP